jgi:exodeoxyribonuclease VII small subunit
MSFEASLARLEVIVRELERNDTDLESALKLFEEGITHLRAAGEALKSVDARVQQLVEAADGSFALSDLGN